MKPQYVTVLACVLVVVFGLLASAGSARADRFEQLRQDERIHSGLIMIAIGRHIELTCPTIERRPVPATTFMWNLARYAMSLGFSRSEIAEYVQDEDEQERVINIAKQVLVERGITSLEDVEGACRLGRDEITSGSQIGRLLQEG